MKKTILAMAMVMLSVPAFCQDSQNTTTTSKDNFEEETYATSSVGLGLGLDYGGIGVKFSGAISEPVALFGGIGYNFTGIGVNGGATFRLTPKKRVIPTLTAMYGYNAAIKVTGSGEDFNKTYYGATFGFGVEFHGRFKTTNFFNLELLVPIRSKEYHDTMDELQDIGVDINDLPPIGISIGYHFGK